MELNPSVQAGLFSVPLQIIFCFQNYLAKKPQIIPPTKPRPSIGAYFPVTMASGKLRTNPTIPPFSQFGIGSSRLKMIKPIANLLMKDAAIALVLFSNCIKNMGIMEAVPKIIPAISPLTILFIFIFLVGRLLLTSLIVLCQYLLDVST